VAGVTAFEDHVLLLAQDSRTSLPEIVVVGHERDRQGPSANDLRGRRWILGLVSQHSRPEVA
jgi:hypothetical protein